MPTALPINTTIHTDEEARKWAAFILDWFDTALPVSAPMGQEMERRDARLQTEAYEEGARQGWNNCLREVMQEVQLDQAQPSPLFVSQTVFDDMVAHGMNTEGVEVQIAAPMMPEEPEDAPEPALELEPDPSPASVALVEEVIAVALDVAVAREVAPPPAPEADIGIPRSEPEPQPEPEQEPADPIEAELAEEGLRHEFDPVPVTPEPVEPPPAAPPVEREDPMAVAVDRVLAGEPAGLVADEAGIRIHKLQGAVVLRKRQGRSNVGRLTFDGEPPRHKVAILPKPDVKPAPGWTKRDDLTLAEHICGRGRLQTAAEALGKTKEECKARWDQLLPIKGIDHQSALIKHLKERVSA